MSDDLAGLIAMMAAALAFVVMTLLAGCGIAYVMMRCVGIY